MERGSDSSSYPTAAAIVNISLRVSSFDRFRSVGAPQPMSAELRDATVLVPGMGPVRSKHGVLTAYNGFPKDISWLPLPMDCIRGATLLTGVPLIPLNMSWVRLTETKHRPTIEPNFGMRTLTRLPGHIVWRGRLSAWSAMALLRDEGGMTVALSSMSAYLRNGKLHPSILNQRQLRVEPERAVAGEIFKNFTPDRVAGTL